MKTQNIPQAAYLDILFANRNKAYGGYELRSHYERRMKLAIFIVLTVSAAIFLSSFIRSADNIPSPAVAHTITTTLTNIKTPVVPVVPKPVSVPAVQPTIANPVPKIVDDKKVTDPPKDVTDMKDKVSGKVDAVGDPAGTVPATTTITGTPGNTTVVADVTPTPSVPARSVERMPEFNGNIMEYMTRNLRYPDRARDGGVEGRVVVEFVVNEDGSISNAKVIRGIGAGCDEEALRVIYAMPRWKPGLQAGKPVKVYYTLPVKYTLE